MRIGQVARRSGLSIDTIRFYEKQGLLGGLHVQRGDNGYRLYAESAIERLAMIKHAQVAGFTLTEIRELFAVRERNQLSDECIVAHLRKKQQQIVATIAQLEQIEQYLNDKLRHYECTTTNPKALTVKGATSQR